jgi:hypothetical protein
MSRERETKLRFKNYFLIHSSFFYTCMTTTQRGATVNGRDGSAGGGGCARRLAGTAVVSQAVGPTVAGLDKWTQTYVL